MYKLCVVIFGFLTMILLPTKVAQAEVCDAEIRIIEEHYLGNGKYELLVNCYIQNEGLINEQLKLSYHIWDGTKADYLAFENERISICQGGTADSLVELNITVPDVKKDSWICFDIVDEKNSFWFDGTGDIVLIKDDIFYTHSFVNNWKAIWWVNIRNNLLILCINIVVFIAFISTAICIRKKEIL